MVLLVPIFPFQALGCTQPLTLRLTPFPRQRSHWAGVEQPRGPSWALLSNPGGKAHGLPQLPPELGEARLGQPESWEHVLFMARSLSGVIQQAVTHHFLELDSERKNRDGHTRSFREAGQLFWS